jgi:DNA-directed RNA polymerase sigma subunit (sigma70/sigma32)
MVGSKYHQWIHQHRAIVELWLRTSGALNAQQADVLCRRFALCGRVPETLASIGHSYGRTRARIRQIESKAARILRQHVHFTVTEE